jgi:cytochrome c-type biogenesis protein CcmH/NrfF
LSGAAPFGILRVMRRVTIVLLALAAVAGLLAQTASEKPNADVRRVGLRLKCQCGCGDSVATCTMLDCGFSKPAKERIAQMEAVGMSDDQIVDAFLRDYGPAVLLKQPSAFIWVVPSASVAAGLLVIWLFIRRYWKPRELAASGAVEADDPSLEKYKDQIEKDLADLE